MKKVVLAAVLGFAVSLGGAAAADPNCYSAADAEAEQAILFQTNLMVTSSACRDTVYGEFRARNKDASEQAVVPTAQVCQQATQMLKLASTLDAKGFHDYAVAHAVNDTHPKC